MSQYVGDPKYNGTLQRAFALVLDHHLIYSKSLGAFVTRDAKRGMDAITDDLIKRAQSHLVEGRDMEIARRLYELAEVLDEAERAVEED